LGLRANAAQFSILVLVNLFVGGMAGLERTVVPLLGAEEFAVSSTTLILSFIVGFGLAKALANLFSGQLADRFGRKPILILGWLFGLPVPLMIIFAPTWGWIIAANVLLGINQGFAWSMTVIMKIDLVGPSRRGLAMGLNEFSGYLAVGVTAFLTGYIAAADGLRPDPFLIGIVYAVLGTALSVFLVRETRGHALHEAMESAIPLDEKPLRFRDVFLRTTWKDRSLFAASQAGLVNNLNDGMSWGIFPLFLAAHAVSLAGIGLIKALYPITWAVTQLATGALSDKWGRKKLIASGMWVQALGLLVIGLGTSNPFVFGIAGSILLGVGTAMVYPVLLAAVSDLSHPRWRARSLSVYRFWRDMGYAVGALLAGLVADSFGLVWSIHAAGFLTFLSGVLVWRTMAKNS
jgi:MFS family permease